MKFPAAAPGMILLAGSPGLAFAAGAQIQEKLKADGHTGQEIPPPAISGVLARNGIF
jgi:hypothetical protein